MSDPESLARMKAQLRLEARATRSAARTEGAADALAARFPAALIGPSPVAAYWPLGGELDPLPLVQRLRGEGISIALPRMLDRVRPPQFLNWAPMGDLAPDAFGVMAPAPGAREVTPAIILTPLLAFDRTGARLGQGGGHYDRILAELKPKGVIAVGLAYAVQEIPVAPMGEFDVRLDWIVTEREAIQIAR